MRADANEVEVQASDESHHSLTRRSAGDERQEKHAVTSRREMLVSAGGDTEGITRSDSLDAKDTAVTEDSKLEAETELFSSTDCGDGEDAEVECVKACMDDKQCRGQAEVMGAIQATNLFKTEEINDGNAYLTGAPCASFYGDNAFGAVGGFFKSGGSTTMTYCKQGDHDAVECKAGKCVAINDDAECTGNAWKDPAKCKIRHKSCGTVAECAEKCMGDSDCRWELIQQGANTPVLDALAIHCVEEEGGEKKCFFTPEKPCTGKCQNEFECHNGRCKPAPEVAAEWSEPEPEEAKPNTGTFAWITGGTKSDEHKCKNFWQSCEGEWTTPADPAADPGCSKCMRSSSCCVKA